MESGGAGFGRPEPTSGGWRGGRRLRRGGRALAALVLAGTALAAPTGARADDSHDGGAYHEVTMTWADYLPCVRVPVEITATVNGTAHSTSNDNSGHWTRTMQGTFSAVPVTFVLGADGRPVRDPETETYLVDQYLEGERFEGRFTLHDGASTSRNASSETFTFAGRTVGSEGTAAQWRAVFHRTTAADALRSAFRTFTCR